MTGLDWVSWGDATQTLGNYINTLAREWYLLKHANLNTRRTEKELYDALYAFERLDKKAEPSWQNYDKTYPYCGGADLPPNIEQPDDINGFFIRGDVPSIRLLAMPPYSATSNFVDNNAAHFHRPGFFYRSPQLDMEEAYGSDANYRTHPPGCVALGNCGPKRGPGEESQDQVVMLYGGLGMAGWLLDAGVTYNGWNLREKARQQLLSMIAWPALARPSTLSGFYSWNIINPVDGQCVGIPRSSGCNAGGASISINAVGATDGLSHVGLPATSIPYHSNYTYNAILGSIPGFAGWHASYQAQQWIAPQS